MANDFIVVVAIILIIQISMLFSFLRIKKVAKAGKVTKFYWKYKLLTGKRPKRITCNQCQVDVSGYKSLYVYGNSMKDYGIQSGQEVFVEVFNDSEKDSITDYPVLAFRIDNSFCQSPFKLRKFVSYIEDLNQVDWEDVFKRFRERIKISKEQFVSECRNKQEKEKEKEKRYILSETYDEDLDTHHYSLHPVSSLYAKVRYVI